MLSGRFGNTTGRPYIEGRIVLPRLHIVGDVSFLIDTGADCSVLMPLDGTRMAIDYSQLQNVVSSLGIGGVSRDYSEAAIIAFSDGINVYVYTPTIRISTPSPDIMGVPSLLGRDVIHRWELNYDFSQNSITMNIRSADITLPISAAAAPTNAIAPPSI